MITRTDPMILYGANGNIVGITRKGKSSSNSYGLMDNLTLFYDGNRLTGVSETVSDYDFTGSFEYKKANGSQYIYNSNGSLVADRSRNIAYITYDYNNNPQTIYFINGNEIRYTYSGTGEKLCAKYYNAVPNVTRAFGVKPEGYPQSQIMCSYQYDYILGGSMVMYNGMIDKVCFDGGYAQGSPISSGYGFTLYYYNKDHLGNNREVLNYSGNVQQLTNYYPFGTPYTDPNAVMGSNVQPYKYNGKELVTMHGLNTYDYGARQYDPILCRWDRVDPLAEDDPGITLYTYCRNNPIIHIDNEGKFPLVANVVGAVIGATVEYGAQVITNVVSKGFSGAFSDINYTSVAIAGAEGFLTSGTSIIKNTGKKAAAHLVAIASKNSSEVLNGNATIGDAIVNSSIDMIGLGKIKTKHFHILKPTTANQAVKAAKSNGRKVTTSEAKKIATNTRKNNLSKKETNAVINGFADSSVPVATTSSIKGVRTKLNDEKEK